MRLKRIPAAFTPTMRQERREWPKTDLRMSVVIPYYKRIRDFARVLPMNAPFLARPDLEAIVCLDEPSEEAQVVELLAAHPKVRSRVLVNDEDHPWRAPTKSINVGIRAARGDLVMVVSPESAFSGDVPSRLIESCDAAPGGTVVGRVRFAKFGEAAHGNGGTYGVACYPREVLNEVRGYDETFVNWGGDDIDLRNRILMAGYALYVDRAVTVVHFSDRIRAGMRGGRTPDEEQLRRSLRPSSPHANPDGWGEAFSREAPVAPRSGR